MDAVHRKSSTHALMEVTGFAKPVLLRFVDKTTGRHRFTVQVPGQEDYSFWIPEGSYWIYLAYTDISDKMSQLVGGNVERDLLEEDRLQSKHRYTLVVNNDAKKARKVVPPDEWGQAGPDKKP
jgi:hypothetical protein